MAYFPNGAAGMILEEQCVDCLLPGDAPCPILLNQLLYNYDQCNNELAKKIMNGVVDEKGTCLMKPLLEKYKDSKNYVDPDQLDLF